MILNAQKTIHLWHSLLIIVSKSSQLVFSFKRNDCEYKFQICEIWNQPHKRGVPPSDYRSAKPAHCLRPCLLKVRDVQVDKHLILRPYAFSPPPFKNWVSTLFYPDGKWPSVQKRYPDVFKHKEINMFLICFSVRLTTPDIDVVYWISMYFEGPGKPSLRLDTSLEIKLPN